MNRHGAVKLIAGIGLAAVSSAWAQNAQRPRARIVAPQAQFRVTSPGCPHDARFTLERTGGAHDTVQYDSMPVSGLISNIPEFHDCQRLLQGTSQAYGPLVGVWASWALDRFDDTLSALRGEAYAVAEVLSWDGPYAPLGIRKGFNCLYMMRDGDSLKAWMMAVYTDAIRCTRSYLPHAAGPQQDPAYPVTSLSVDFETDSSGTGADIPPVARWDWNPRNNTQTIGVKCGPRWCIVGSSRGFNMGIRHRYGSAPWHTRMGPNIPSRDVARVIENRGWHDEQLLDPAEGRKTLASSITVGAYPHPSLRGYTAEVFADFQYHPSAFVVMTMPARPDQNARNIADQYRAKYNFTPDSLNRIDLCAGPPGTGDRMCSTGHQPAPACNIEAPDEAWTARVTNGEGATRFFCVRKCTFPENVAGPFPSLARVGIGTVRWRWKEIDGTLWISCPKGCCTLN